MLWVLLLYIIWWPWCLDQLARTSTSSMGYQLPPTSNRSQVTLSKKAWQMRKNQYLFLSKVSYYYLKSCRWDILFSMEFAIFINCSAQQHEVVNQAKINAIFLNLRLLSLTNWWRQIKQIEWLPLYVVKNRAENACRILNLYFIKRNLYRNGKTGWSTSLHGSEATEHWHYFI